MWVRESERERERERERVRVCVSLKWTKEGKVYQEKTATNEVDNTD